MFILLNKMKTKKVNTNLGNIINPTNVTDVTKYVDILKNKEESQLKFWKKALPDIFKK